MTTGLFGEGYIVSSAQDGDATSDKNAAEPKNKDANKTFGFKFDGFENGGLASAKFDNSKPSVCVAQFSNLTPQTKGEVNLSSNLACGVKFDSAAKNVNLTQEADDGLNLAHKKGDPNLNVKFNATQILLADKRQTLFTEQGGRANLTQKPVLTKAQNV